MTIFKSELIAKYDPVIKEHLRDVYICRCNSLLKDNYCLKFQAIWWSRLDSRWILNDNTYDLLKKRNFPDMFPRQPGRRRIFAIRFVSFRSGLFALFLNFAAMSWSVLLAIPNMWTTQQENSCKIPAGFTGLENIFLSCPCYIRDFILLNNVTRSCGAGKTILFAGIC